MVGNYIRYLCAALQMIPCSAAWLWISHVTLEYVRFKYKEY